MNITFEYTDEVSLHPHLICSICQLPLTDPRDTPCDKTFCRECITKWIQTQRSSCPVCQKSLSVDDLTKTSRIVRTMLDQLPVKCKACGQSGLKRGNFDEHIHTTCPKAVVTCPSTDINCPWTGQRDQLNQHQLDCCFQSMGSVIIQLISEKQELIDQVNQQNNQIKEQQSEIQHLKQLINQQTTQITVLQNKKQPKGKGVRSATKPSTSEPENRPAWTLTSTRKQLSCGGHACPECDKCHDWYVRTIFGLGYGYEKRSDATCRLRHSDLFRHKKYSFNIFSQSTYQL